MSIFVEDYTKWQGSARMPQAILIRNINYTRRLSSVVVYFIIFSCRRY